MTLPESIKTAYTNYLLDLIRIPSLTGEEGPCAEYVFSSLKAIGAESFIDTAGNVVGILSSGEGPVVLLNSHLDVVSPGSIEAWAPYSPFEGHIEGDRLIGRGAADIKGGLAAQFFAFKYFKEHLDKGRPFKGTLIFSAVVHEEAAEMLGMQALIEETLPHKGIKPDICILGEPSGGRIAMGHPGKVELVVSTHGRTAHSSQPSCGVNALEKMLPVMHCIFNEMPDRLKTHPLLGKGSITITNCMVKPGKQSIVPDLCEISIDRRYIPGEDIPGLIAEFEALFAGLKKNDREFHAKIEPRRFLERTWTGYEKNVLKYHPGWITDPNLPIVKKAVSGLADAGQSPGCFYWKFGTDGSMTAALHGIPTIGYSHAEEKWAHQPKEQVSVTAMFKTIEGLIAIGNALFADLPLTQTLSPSTWQSRSCFGQ
jgi:putative selenium metabolism hydrolase